MQENKRSGFKTWLQEKGYYIVLVLCVAAVGISGYLYFTQDTTEPVQSVSSGVARHDIPASVTKPEPSVPDTEPETKSEANPKPATPDAPEAHEDSRASSVQKPPEKVPEQERTQTLSIRWPVEGALQQSFAVDHLAYNATTQDWRVHNGVDLSADLGAQVCAAADGTVTAIINDDFLGKTIVLTHAGDYSTRYSNLADEVLVSIGDEVKAGQAIATVGETALLEVSDAPHIHFVVTQGNQTLNPEPLLSES